MINGKQARKYCRDDIRLIEGYAEAIADTTQTWVCHHVLEIQDDGKVLVSPEQLIQNSLYFDRPAEELCFMTASAHRSLHGRNLSAKTRAKRSTALSSENHPFFGKHHSKETREKMSVALLGKRHSTEAKEKMSVAMLGKRWWNNGVKNIRAKECPSEGWKRGRLKKGRQQ